MDRWLSVGRDRRVLILQTYNFTAASYASIRMRRTCGVILLSRHLNCTWIEARAIKNGDVITLANRRWEFSREKERERPETKKKGKKSEKYGMVNIWTPGVSRVYYIKKVDGPLLERPNKLPGDILFYTQYVCPVIQSTVMNFSGIRSPTFPTLSRDSVFATLRKLCRNSRVPLRLQFRMYSDNFSV